MLRRVRVIREEMSFPLRSQSKSDCKSAYQYEISRSMFPEKIAARIGEGHSESVLCKEHETEKT